MEKRWWELDQDKAHESIHAVVKGIDSEQSSLNQDYLDFAKLYGNADILGLSANSYSRTGPDWSSAKRLKYNIIKSCIDTVANRISKNKPRPMFLTAGGDWSMQTKAKRLNKFIEGSFYGSKMYPLGQRAFLDSLVFGTGVTKFYRHADKLCAERALITELKVPEGEAFYGEPRQMHQVKDCSKDVLMHLFPKFKNDILNSHAQNEFQSGKREEENVCVIESWHLPSGEDGKDGKHAISIQNKVLLWEDWKRSSFPFAEVKWSDRLFGWRGQGLAEELMGIQVEINRLLQVITEILRLTVPKLFVEKGSKVVYAHFNNKIGGIIEYTGIKPVYDFLQAVPQDLVNQLERLIQRAYEISGISQLSAQSKKPSGLDSGKALREFNDIETERFILKGQAYEDYFLKAADNFISMASEAKEEGINIKSSYPGKKGVEIIGWNEIALAKDQYIMKMFPASALSQTPSARLQDVQELIQSGFIPREDAVKLLDFPDLEAATRKYSAPSEDIDMVIEQIIDKNNYIPPEPYQPLDYGIKTMQSAYLRAKLDNVPEERLELMRRWMDSAQSMLQASLAPQTPAGAMNPPPTIAGPEAAPTSDLLPFGGAVPQG